MIINSNACIIFYSHYSSTQIKSKIEIMRKEKVSKYEKATLQKLKESYMPEHGNYTCTFTRITNTL